MDETADQLPVGTPPMEVAAPASKTLRDEFAMYAMNGFLADPSLQANANGNRQIFFTNVAYNSYQLADAMMKVRG